MHLDHVHVLAVQLAEHLGRDDLAGACRWPPGPRPGRRPGPSPAAAGSSRAPRSARRSAAPRRSATAARRSPARCGCPGSPAARPAAAGRAADQRVRDQDPLLLAAGQVAHPLVGEPLGADRPQHLVDPLAAPARGQRDAEPVPVKAEADKVAGAQRQVGVQQDLLRHVADQPAAPGRAARRSDRAGPAHPDLAGRGRLQPEDDPQQRGLPRAVGRR